MTREYLKILHLEIWSLIKLIIAKAISCFVKVDDLWLISERGDEARDNAYVFFVWLKKNHPEVNAKFIISKKSKDLSKLEPFMQDIVFYDTPEHYLKLFQASYLISTHICGYRPKLAIFSELDRRYDILRGQKRIFLQHGITKDNIKGLYASNVHLDLFISGAKDEYDYITSNFGYKDNVVQLTGFCRYDNLYDFKVKNQILIMPTWRMYLNDSQFGESEYYQTFKSLLTNIELHDLSENYGYEIIFYPHYEVQKHIDLFKNLELPSNITIADQSYDVQTLLKESRILITDYSSVYFDFAYMRKPIIYYQFDYEDFISKHYDKGYFDESSFGPKVINEEELLNELEWYIHHNAILKPDHSNNIDSFFPIRDKENCQRVYNSIRAL